MPTGETSGEYGVADAPIRKPLIYEVRLTPRGMWKMAENMDLTLNVGRLKIQMPRIVRAVICGWYGRKYYPVKVHLYQPEDLFKSE